jgi:hypothetical protein
VGLDGPPAGESEPRLGEGGQADAGELRGVLLDDDAVR